MNEKLKKTRIVYKHTRWQVMSTNNDLSNDVSLLNLFTFPGINTDYILFTFKFKVYESYSRHNFIIAMYNKEAYDTFCTPRTMSLATSIIRQIRLKHFIFLCTIEKGRPIRVKQIQCTGPFLIESVVGGRDNEIFMFVIEKKSQLHSVIAHYGIWPAILNAYSWSVVLMDPTHGYVNILWWKAN